MAFSFLQVQTIMIKWLLVTQIQIGVETNLIEEAQRVTSSWFLVHQFHGALENNQLWHCPHVRQSLLQTLMLHAKLFGLNLC